MEERVKFCFITANYGRPKIFKLFCAGVRRLREELNYNFPVIVTSDIDDKEVCEEYGIKHYVQANNPVSDKFNTSCMRAKDLDVDYVVIVGSDDLIATNSMLTLWAEMKKGYDLIGITNVYFYDANGPHKGKLLQLKGTRMLGVCKCIHRRVLDEVGWKPWNKKKDWGLDSVAAKAISPHVKTWKQVDGVRVFDCKTKTNLNKFHRFYGHWGAENDISVFHDTLGEEELKLIKAL